MSAYEVLVLKSLTYLLFAVYCWFRKESLFLKSITDYDSALQHIEELRNLIERTVDIEVKK